MDTDGLTRQQRIDAAALILRDAAEEVLAKRAAEVADEQRRAA